LNIINAAILKKIIQRSASILNTTIAEDAAGEIARRSRAHQELPMDYYDVYGILRRY
jgi:Holliday junction resolvasome RuvABC ATP-dependent DNA helicase subunit